MEKHGKTLVSSELQAILGDVDDTTNGTLSVRVDNDEYVKLNVFIKFLHVLEDNSIEVVVENFDVNFATWMIGIKSMNKVLSMLVSLQTNALPNIYRVNDISICYGVDARCMLTLRGA
jgi:hypothetical protein